MGGNPAIATLSDVLKPKENCMTTGYVDCACYYCLEIAIGEPGQAICSDCEQAECTLEEEADCNVPKCSTKPECE